MKVWHLHVLIAMACLALAGCARWFENLWFAYFSLNCAAILIFDAIDGPAHGSTVNLGDSAAFHPAAWVVGMPFLLFCAAIIAVAIALYTPFALLHECDRALCAETGLLGADENPYASPGSMEHGPFFPPDLEESLA